MEVDQKVWEFLAKGGVSPFSQGETLRERGSQVKRIQLQIKALSPLAIARKKPGGSVSRHLRKTM